MTENPKDITADDSRAETELRRLERIQRSLSTVSEDHLCGLVRRGALGPLALTVLASHKSPDVRVSVAESPETEEDVLRALSSSAWTAVADAARKNLAARSAEIRPAPEAKPSACASAMADDAKEDCDRPWVPNGTTSITCGVRCHEKSVSYTTVAWPSGVEVETGTARTVSFLHEALRRAFTVLGTDLKRCVSMVVAEIGGKSQPVAELWYGSTSTPWWSAYLTDSVEGLGWAFKTRGTTILVRVRPRQKRTREWHLAELALGILEMGRNPDPAETKVMSPAELDESAAAWRAMEAGYDGARAERAMPPATAEALPKSTARELEQQRRYREILRETLIVEAFKAILPTTFDATKGRERANSLATVVVMYADAVMANAFESREVAGG